MIARGRTIRFARLATAVALALTLGGRGGRAAATTYVFSTFKGDDAAGMKLSIYTSTDSVNFTLLSDTGFGGNTSYLRDPSIMRYTDGKYYLAYTDPMTASCCNPEDHFGIAVSADLTHWTDLVTVKAGVAGVSRTWAPEWFVEGGVVRIIANIDTGNQLPNFEPYVFTAQNSALTSWSGPTALGIGADYIDTFVARRGDTYHAFVKNDVTRYLEHATAPGLTGPWTFVGKGDWAGWGSGMEGPAIVQLDDGRYRMYVDPQSGGAPCQTMTSSDLVTWSAKASIPGPAGAAIRHGTVVRDMAGPGSNGDFGGTGAPSDAGVVVDGDLPAEAGRASGTGGTGTDAGGGSMGGAGGGNGGAGGSAPPGSGGATLGSGGLAGGPGGLVGGLSSGGASSAGGAAETGGQAGATTSSGPAHGLAVEPGGGCGCRVGTGAGQEGVTAIEICALLGAIAGRRRSRATRPSRGPGAGRRRGRPRGPRLEYARPMAPAPGTPRVPPHELRHPPRVTCAGRATVTLALALALGAMASLGCQPLSQIILIIDSNLPADQFDYVTLTIKGPSSPATDKTLNPNPPQMPPWTMGLVPSGDATPQVWVTAQASSKDSPDPVVEQRAITEFVKGESRLLRILLLTSCMGVVCPSGQVCGANGCGPIEQIGASLPTWNGDIPPRPSPDPTFPILGRTVWAGGWHSCAIEGTALYCWGQNKFGELGNNTTLNSSDRQRIVLPSNTALPLRAVGLGNINTCVCDGSGKAYCWGDDTSGQIGNPAVTAALQPVQVPGLTDCVQIGGGGAHMCAVHADATVSCWGDNSYGQAGGRAPMVPTPTLVVDMAGVTFANVLEVFGGEDFTCARRMDKTVWCWGNNVDHRLGDGTTVARSTPVQVVGVAGAEELAIGRFTACARLTGGTVMCWGQNTNGQLGTGDTKAAKFAVPVVGITDAAQISLGRDHACLLHASPAESVACWGSNAYGQLGIGANPAAGPPVLKPTTILTIVGVSSIAAGSVHTCARHSKGLSCWGENVVNELGDNTSTNRGQPVLVSDFP